MNREEVDHGCSPEESKKVEIEKEGQESYGEKEDRPEALHVEEKVRRKEKEGRAEESGRQEEVSAEEVRAEEICAQQASRAEARGAKACARCSCAGRIRSCRRAEPGHLSPVQPAGRRRQFG
jgi:hypothetical protein